MNSNLSAEVVLALSSSTFAYTAALSFLPQCLMSVKLVSVVGTAQLAWPTIFDAQISAEGTKFFAIEALLLPRLSC